jgi:hypothetical protein
LIPPAADPAGAPRIIGYCRPIYDLLAHVPPGSIDAVLRGLRVPRGVSFVDEETATEAVRLLDSVAPNLEWSPGGPVSNSLFAIGSNLAHYPRPVALTWAGPLSLGEDRGSMDGIASLRRVGVHVECPPQARVPVQVSVCLIDLSSGEVAAILVGPRTELRRGRETWTPADTVLVRLADLAELLDASPDLDALGGMAVVLADVGVPTDAAVKALQDLAAADKLRFMFGQLSEFVEAGLATDDSVAPFLESAEILGTAGGGPVAISARGDVGLEYLDIDTAVSPTTSFLGSGDSYAGVYLGERLRGTAPPDAHREAVQAARLSSYSHTARRNYRSSLTEAFGAFIDRAADTDDWAIFETVRNTSGLTVIACGQPGVDTAGLRAAVGWGLATFAVMPRGPRNELTDAGRDAAVPAGARLLQLGSPSYRYCTWANVFLADGTVLIDLARGEGSAETRRAARELARPLFEISADPTDAELSELEDWCRRHAVRVLNIAGSRASGLRPKQRDAVRRAADAVVRACAATYGTAVGAPPEPAAVAEPARSILGVPALAEVRRAVADQLVGGESVALPSYRDAGEVEVVFGRSIDLVRMLERGLLDAALVGEDMLIEHDSAGLEVMARAGVFNCLLALVSRAGDVTPPSTVVSQYPRFAARELSRRGVAVTAVVGAAEGWVAGGLFDATVDTWRTGATATANGLDIARALRVTTLALVRRTDAEITPALRLGWDLLRGFQRPNGRR